MNASKENCKTAKLHLAANSPFIGEEAYSFLKEFLEAAGKRLPSEAALERDKFVREIKKGK